MATFLFFEQKSEGQQASKQECTRAKSNDATYGFPPFRGLSFQRLFGLKYKIKNGSQLMTVASILAMWRSVEKGKWIGRKRRKARSAYSASIMEQPKTGVCV